MNTPALPVWGPPETYARVAKALGEVGADRLKPIFIHLEEKVPYDAIKLVLAHLSVDQPAV